MSRRLSDDELRKRLASAGLSGLAPALAQGLAKLRQQKAATGVALSAKFAAEGDAYKGEMGFASLDGFFGGLESLVGPPLMIGGSLMKQMEHEHSRAPDAQQPFNTSNGVVGACSADEWSFVVAHDAQRRRRPRLDAVEDRVVADKARHRPFERARRRFSQSVRQGIR